MFKEPSIRDLALAARTTGSGEVKKRKAVPS